MNQIKRTTLNLLLAIAFATVISPLAYGQSQTLYVLSGPIRAVFPTGTASTFALRFVLSDSFQNS
jgi:hypothetical protein